MNDEKRLLELVKFTVGLLTIQDKAMKNPEHLSSGGLRQEMLELATKLAMAEYQEFEEFHCPECDGPEFRTLNQSEDSVDWIRECKNCKRTWLAIDDDNYQRTVRVYL